MNQLTNDDYAYLLPGLEPGDSPAFRMLARLIGQGIFELLDAEEGVMDRRAVYLMNDAAECFLTFTNAALTGTYRPDYEGELSANLSREEERYILSIRQGETIFSLFFTDLKLEQHLYNYGEVGHFWVEKHEHLRLLEYHIAIMADKLEYLGEDSCSLGERELAVLRDFPPLNYCCYPAAPARYVVGSGRRPWYLSVRAVDLMIDLAGQVGDTSLKRILVKYRGFPRPMLAKTIAFMLHRTKHYPIIARIEELILREAAHYPDREFDGEVRAALDTQLAEAQTIASSEVPGTLSVRIIREEPFADASDDTEPKVYVLRCVKHRGDVEAQVTRA